MNLTPYHAKYMAHELTLRSTEGVERIAQSLFDAAVDLNPHQIEAAVFALDNPLAEGVILADEVGLGKTIEAGPHLFGEPAHFRTLYGGRNGSFSDLKTRLKPYVSRTLRKDVLEYIRYTERKAITQPFELGTLRSAGEYRKIVRDTRSVTAWVHDELLKIASCAEQEEKSRLPVHHAEIDRMVSWGANNGYNRTT